MRKIIFILIILFFSVFSQLKAGYFFYIQLKDKNNTPYSIANPTEYLSQRAIERRAYYNVPIDSADLPVNPQYISQITDLNIYVHAKTKWLNGVTVLLNDSSKMAFVRSLPFVKFVQYTGKNSETPMAPSPRQNAKSAEFDYGNAAQQIKQLKGEVLHQNGFSGENIHIAVIDAGFYGADVNPGFQRMRDENRLLGIKDFVNPQSNIYTTDAHGAFVLSTMATELDETFVGTAPNASYLLIRTEAAAGEYLYEPDLWISGIEYADSAGVDLATTSLGYSTFDDASMNYAYEQMDGKTIRASIAANMAFKKGMVLLNSAGNEGNKAWKYISAPADAEGVITVGSVNKDGNPSSFSSFGPSADGRVKPELCSTGGPSALTNSNGSTTYSSGTSFATPILAGLTACFLQAAKAKNPTHTLAELYEILNQSGSLYSNPTPQMGYGIPDFSVAYDSLVALSVPQLASENNKMTHKIIVRDAKPLKFRLPDTYKTHSNTAELYNTAGQLCAEIKIINNTVIINSDALSAGVYVLKIQ